MECGRCVKTKSCAIGLPGIYWGNGNTLCPTPHATRRAVFEQFKMDEVIAAVDIFLCAMPAAMCELYMPFNRSIIMLVSTPYSRTDISLDPPPPGGQHAHSYTRTHTRTHARTRNLAERFRISFIVVVP
jgi:hypothetical protein